jgi:RHS repeat-associated protein
LNPTELMRMSLECFRVAAKILACSALLFAGHVAHATSTLYWSVGPSVYAPNGLLAPSGGTVNAGLSATAKIIPAYSTATVSSFELREVVGTGFSTRATYACSVTYEPGSTTPDDLPCSASLAAPLTVGTHDLYLHAFTAGTGAFGGDSAHVIVTVTANHAPTVSISSPANGTQIATASGSASLTVTASGADVDNNLSSVSASIDGAATSLSGSTGINSAIALAVGHHTISVTSTDALGGTATSSVGVDILADSAPVATLQSPANGARFQAISSTVAVSVQGTGSDPDAAGTGGAFDHLSLTVDGAANTSATATSLSATLNLAPGTHSIVLTATDKLGLATSTTSNITVLADRPPQGSLSAPTAGQVYTVYSGAAATVTVTGTMTDPDSALSDSVSRTEVWLDGAPVASVSGGSVNTTTSASGSGSHTVKLHAFDSSNTAGDSPSVNFTIVTLGPVIGNVDGVSYDTTNQPILSGWACDKNVAASVNVAVYAGGPVGTGTQVGTVTANLASEAAVGSACGTGGGTYRWSFPLSSLIASRAGQALNAYGISAKNGGALTLLPGTFSVPAVNAPRPVTVSPPNLSGGIAGTIPGQAGVSSRGASQYSFNIAVPPGTAGMSPSLGLSYDSENPIDIGGVGWSLTGLSTITRCKRTLATDGHVHPVDLTAADAYCLNGERLILISGTEGATAEYRTEIETFQRVKSFGSNTAVGPDYWTVETRDGRILTIGGAGNSTVLATKQSTPINWVWMLQRVQDQHGNFMTYVYELSTTGEYYPTQILYTGNTAAGLVPYNSVDFLYEARNDVFSGRVSDVLIQRPNRLKQIRTRIGVAADGTGGTIARQWNFAYSYSPYSNRSLLQSVTDCNSDGSQCLPSTTFTWTQRDASKNTTTAPGSGTWNGPGIPIQIDYTVDPGIYTSGAQFGKRAAVGDFNGDGKQDLLVNAAGSSTWTLCPSIGTNFNCMSVPGMPAVSSENFFVGDVNGDGLSDVLVATGPGQPWYLCLSTGTGFTCSQTTGLPAAMNYINTQYTPLVGDFNGDGRDDILFQGTLCTSTGSAFNCAPYNSNVYGMWDTAPANPSEYTYPSAQMMADFDGDGQIDILAYQASSTMDPYCTLTPTNNCHLDTTDFYRYTVAPGGLVLTSQGENRKGAFRGKGTVDVNGDGVADLLWEGSVLKHNANGTTASSTYYMNTCVGGTVCSATPNQSTDELANVLFVGDYLQTGAHVGIYGLNASAYVVPFNVNGTQGTAGTTIPWTYTIDCTSAVGSLSIDVDGDGLPDMLCYIPNGYPSTTGTWKVWLTGSGSFPDRLQSVTDGNKLTTSWTYTSGNDSTVVFPGTPASYPTKNVHVTAPVVSKMSVDADSSQTAGKTLDTTYWYSGMRTDSRGRGSLGFDTVKSTETIIDQTTGLPANVVTTTQYSQSFPIIARTTSVTKTGGGVTLHSDVSTWATLTSPTGQLYPYVRKEVTTGQDLDGTWLPLTTMQVGTDTQGASDGIDAYGNIVKATTTSAENNGAGDSYQVVRNCSNYNKLLSSSQWVLGLCTDSSQTATPVNPSTSASRQVKSYFDSFGALQSTTSMSGTSLALTVAYSFDPNVGVPMSVTKTWTDPLDGTVKSLKTSMTYDSKWRFPATVTNPLNQTETYGYDDATGAETKVIDVNNLTTSWKVDAWGRKTEEDRPDGTYSTMAHRKCVDSCGSLAKSVDIVQHWTPGGVQMLAPEETFADSRGRKLLYRTWNDSNVEADTTWSYGDMGDLYSQTLPKYTTDSATGTTTTSVIDILHRPKQIDRTNAAGTGVDTTRYAYSALTTAVTDANLHTRTQLLNAQGKVKAVTDNNRQAVNYTYDGFGDLLSTTDPNGNVVRMFYDVMGHKTSMQDPDLGNWSYVVDAAGHTRQQTDAKNQVTTLWYDLLDRLTERLEPDLDSRWAFDSAPNGVGKLAESYTWIAATSTKDFRHVYAYDSLSRPSWSTTTLDWDYTELNTYDAFGHLATVTHRRSAIGAANSASNPTGNGAIGLPEIQYTLGYDTSGAVSSVLRGSSTLWMLNSHDAAGRTRLATFGSGLVTATGYNQYTALLESIQTGTSNGGSGVNATIQSNGYGYDPVGNLLTRSWLPASSAAAMSESFTYDELDRLKTSQVNGLDQKNFNYDALGNITLKSNVGTYAYDPAHPHLVSRIAGTVVGLTNPGFSYDANGNTQNGLNRQYAWSAANLPVSVDQLSDGTRASATLRHEFMYGPNRERTREIVRTMSGTSIGAVQRTIYTAGSIEKEIDAVAGTTKIRTYLPLGLGFTEEDFTGTAIVPTSVATPMERYAHKDNIGSIDVVTDASQTVLQRMAYDPWGRRRQSNGLEVGWQYLNAQSATNTLDHKGYTGQEQLDDLSLVHLNGRVYDPMTGRFTSPDPTIPDPYDLQSLNRASYVRNSPMDKVDPTGFTEEEENDSLRNTSAKSSNGTHGWDGGAGTPQDQRRAALAQKKLEAKQQSQGNSIGTLHPAQPAAEAKGAGGCEGHEGMCHSGGFTSPTAEDLAARQKATLGSLGSMGLDSLPFVGTGKSAWQLGTGKDLVTGEDSPGWANGIGLAAGLIPFGKLGVRVLEEEAIPAIKAGAAGGETAGKSFSQAVRDAAKAENPLNVCVYCRREGVATQVDHSIPRARGGNATLDNAQLACPHCNASKGARDFPVNPPPGYRGEWPPSHWGQ